MLDEYLSFIGILSAFLTGFIMIAIIFIIIFRVEHFKKIKPYGLIILLTSLTIAISTHGVLVTSISKEK